MTLKQTIQDELQQNGDRCWSYREGLEFAMDELSKALEQIDKLCSANLYESRTLDAKKVAEILGKTEL